MKLGAFWAVSLLTAVLAIGAGTMPVLAEDIQPAETTASVTTAVSEETTTAAAETASAQVTSLTTETTAETTSTQVTSLTTETTAAETSTETAPAKNGWEEKDGKRFYRLKNGEYARGEVTIDGVPYLFGYRGAQKTDWQTVEGKRRYYDPKTGEAVMGWLDYFDHRYYISADDGKLSGWQTIGETAYCFTEEGILLTGAFTDGERSCFSDAVTGAITAGLHELDSRLILTDADGVILYGWQEQDGNRYYIAEDTGFVQLGLFQADGAWYLGTKDGLASGEQELDGDRVLFDETTCALQTGWFTLGEKRYYLDPGTRKCCRDGFFRIQEEIYYFKPDGTLGNGLTKVSGRLFALDENGKRLTGLQTIDGANYYFDPESGCAVTGKAVTPEGVIRLGTDGKQVFGWQKIGEDYYYTDPVTGLVLPGQQIIDGSSYWFEDDGKYNPDHIIDGRLYDQNDPYWATVKFNEKDGSDMKTSACGIFSFCNAIYALNEKKPDAVEVAYWAISVDAYRPGSGGTMRKTLYDNIEQRYGEELGFRLGGQFYGTIEDARLQQHLMNGNVAVIHVPNHFMAVIGYDPYTRLYHVLDSCESESRGLPGDSWVTADKLSNGKTKVDWYVLISNR